jgi:two-component sensor histidine kinase
MSLKSGDTCTRKGRAVLNYAFVILFCLGLPAIGLNAPLRVDTLSGLSNLRRAIQDSSYITLSGNTITVRGVANTSSGLLHERYLQIYIQDDSAGISLFGSAIHEPVAPGDSVVATGTVREYFGMVEVRIEEYHVLPGKSHPPDPQPLKRALESPDEFEGMLVSGSGILRSKGYRYNGKYLVVAPDDTSQNAIMVYVSNFHARYNDFDFSVLSIGDHINVTGVLSRYKMDVPGLKNYKLFLRTPEDLSYHGLPQYYIWLILMSVSGISVLALGWNFMLKGRVEKQTKLIQASLDEKELLLQEIHHRVKNNLAIISGLIELQIDSTQDDTARKVLVASQNRIQSMALVHEKLYKSTTLANVDLDNYIKELVDAIYQTFEDDRNNIRIDYHMHPVKMGIRQVIPCGLLINELVVNAFKHAFKDTSNGLLQIKLEKIGDIVKIKIADNGRGMPADDKTDSLGLLLVQTFVDQLGATMEIEQNHGTIITVQFKISKDTSS